MARYLTPRPTTTEVQVEKATRYDLRLPGLDLKGLGVEQNDEVYIHFVGEADVRVKLSYAQVRRLLEGDSRVKTEDMDPVPSFD